MMKCYCLEMSKREGSEEVKGIQILLGVVVKGLQILLEVVVKGLQILLVVKEFQSQLVKGSQLYGCYLTVW